MSYWTKDGIKLDGSTPRQVMMSLRRQAWFGGKDLDSYMRKCARFAGYLTGNPVRAGDAAELLTDLLTNRLIIEKGDN